MPTREEATRLFEQRRDAWLGEDVDAYLALWAEDMTFQSPVHESPLRGRAAFGELVRRSFAFSRPVAFEFAHIAVHGATVLAGRGAAHSGGTRLWGGRGGKWGGCGEAARRYSSKFARF